MYITPNGPLRKKYQLGWRVWCLDLRFKVKKFDDITYLPMTLTFQGHDLCELTFWVIS